MTTLSSIIPPVSVSTASGTLPATNGGTGLTSPGTAGNILTSDGTGWVSGAAPSSAVSYPQNVQSGNYTLVLGDAGKQIYSANTGAQTITIPANASVAFPIGTVITIVNAGTNSITLATSGVSLYRNGNAAPLEFATVSVRSSVQLLKTGTNSWDTTFGTIFPVSVSYVVVAGGGAGGYYGTEGGGAGGGAGGMLSGAVEYSRGTQTVTVGSGGAIGANGANSVFGSVTTTGGGRATQPGGSGGGGQAGGGGQTGIAGQGNNGGSGYYDDQSYLFFTGGGGGGAGAVGGSSAGATIAGNGGNGLSTSITGTAVTLAGGGGGTSYYASGTGGTGGGGRGGKPVTGVPGITPTPGTANTGGGGGGAVSTGQQFGTGGSGVVIISCPVPATATTGSPTITTVGSNTVYVFNSSGTITF